MFDSLLTLYLATSNSIAEVKILESEVAVYYSSSDRQLSESRIKQQNQTIREDGLIFELQDCRVVEGSSLPFVCVFLIQNPGTDERRVTIHRDARTVVYDGLGNTISRPRVEYGSSSGSTYTRLPPGINVSATLSFPSVPQRGVSLIELSTNTGGRRSIVSFRPNQ